MLSTHEEHAMYYSNHSLKEFIKVYEKRVASGENFLRDALKSNYLSVETIRHLSAKIKLDKSRLEELDQLLARSCDVKFINVTRQLYDAGKI